MPGQNPSAALPAGFATRPMTAADIEDVVGLLNDYYELCMGLRKFTVDDARGLLGRPGFDAADSTLLVLSPQGRLAGGMIVIDGAPPPVHPNALGCVRPSFEGQGIGTYLVHWAIERGRQAVAQVPEGARVSLYLIVPGQHEPTVRLLEKLGMQALRHNWLMAIDLEQPPPEPRWPQGITVRTFQERPDLRAVYRAADEAFRDHWGHVQRPEEEGIRHWQRNIDGDATFDPSLWFLAMAGEEIAAVALCRARAGEDPSMAFVDTLGVRRPWRRQGLALSLLHHVFGEFYRRGQKRVGLGVDAGSLTGATRLHERAGMRVAQKMTAYEIELRAGQELSRQALP